MSRTRRKDARDHIAPVTFVMNGEAVSTAPSDKEKRKAHADCKKSYKPGSSFKRAQRKKDASKPKHALKAAVAQGKDFDNLVLPDAKKRDVWDYN